MNIWRCELTDNRSVLVRFGLRVLWLSVGFVFVWLFYPPHKGMKLFCAGAMVYVAVLGFVFDHWKLRHPEISDRTMWWLGFAAMLPLLAIPTYPAWVAIFRTVFR